MPTFITCGKCIRGDHSRHGGDRDGCVVMVWNPLQAREQPCACGGGSGESTTLGEFGRTQSEGIAMQVSANQRALSLQEAIVAPCVPCGNSKHARCRKPRANRCCCL
jgi:hypothetical protein